MYRKRNRKQKRKTLHVVRVNELVAVGAQDKRGDAREQTSRRENIGFGAPSIKFRQSGL